MKIAWLILSISALTDFVITAATALLGHCAEPVAIMAVFNAVVLLAVLGGLVSAGRTIQQALKATPEQAAALRG